MPVPRQEGVSYRDVAHAMKEVARTWGCRLHLVMTLPINSSTGKLLDVALREMGKNEKGLWVDKGGITRPWPTNGYSTLAGLCLALCYEYDAQKQRAAEAAERGEKGQLALW